MRVAPYHPASSGATERCVQSVKQRPRKHAAGIHISKEHWVVNFLLRYRCTPHSIPGVSPAELFLKQYRCTPHSVPGVSPAELFLKRYCCTPLSITGVSPAEIFLKRSLRNRFSLLKYHMAKDMGEKQQKQKWQHDRSGVKLRELVIGDPGHVRNHQGVDPG